MPRAMHRRTATRVKHGHVQKKNRWEETPDDSHGQTHFFEVIKKALGAGCVHVVDELDIARFIKIIPDWSEISCDLKSIVIDRFEENVDGCCRHDGVIHLYAWERSLIRNVEIEYF